MSTQHNEMPLLLPAQMFRDTRVNTITADTISSHGIDCIQGGGLVFIVRESRQTGTFGFPLIILDIFSDSEHF